VARKFLSGIKFLFLRPHQKTSGAQMIFAHPSEKLALIRDQFQANQSIFAANVE
jgi:hypothetical protein